MFRVGNMSISFVFLITRLWFLAGTVEAYDVVIVGGSAAGLSAALSLGRSRRSVLVVDSGKPCNVAQPYSFNFLTSDGDSPENIARQAFESVAKYETVNFCPEQVVQVVQESESCFNIETSSGDTYSGRSLIIATGMVDELPNLPGAPECWGRSLIHCPYCHGFEFKDKPTALWMTASNVMKMAPIIRGLTDELTVITQSADLQGKDLQQLAAHKIQVVDGAITAFAHTDGFLQSVTTSDSETLQVDAVYIRPPLRQALPWDEFLPGLEMNNGYLEVDADQGTALAGVFACGDCTTTNRALSIAVASGTKAAKMLNFQLAMRDWNGAQ